jgi:hypothetical protein
MSKIRLTALQRKALVAALDHRVSEINPQHPHQIPNEFPAVTLRSLEERGLLTGWGGPRYMPQYFLTDSGRKVAEALKGADV